jgi:hypothetical protein
MSQRKVIRELSYLIDLRLDEHEFGGGLINAHLHQRFEAARRSVDKDDFTYHCRWPMASFTSGSRHREILRRFAVWSTTVKGEVRPTDVARSTYG